MVLSFLRCGEANSQRVGSKSYDLLLKTLLKHSVNEISCSEANLLQQQPNSSVIWLDAREKNEFEVSQISNAQWVGYNDFSLDRVALLPKNTPIVVYCSVGYRSEKISEKLQAAGFTSVSNLYGGIFEWANQGYGLTDSNGQATTKVHAYDRLWGQWLRKGQKVY